MRPSQGGDWDNIIIAFRATYPYRLRKLKEGQRKNPLINCLWNADGVAYQNPTPRLGGLFDPSMILYLTKLIEKIGQIVEGSEVSTGLGGVG